MAERQLDEHLATDRQAFFDTLREGFRRAAGSAGVIDKTYSIAGMPVRIRFAGPGLIPALTPALAHLEVDSAAQPELSIEVFDSVSTATPLPLMASSLVELIRLRWWERLDRRREIHGYHGGAIRSVFHLGPDILSLLDSKTNQALYWIEDARNIPYYEKGYPLTTLLNWWLTAQQRFFVHAAALGTPSGGVLIPGKGGSGKSTTTLACVGSALRVVGDDYCAVDVTGRMAYSLFNTVKLKGLADVARFQQWQACISNLDRVGEGEEQEKAMIFLHEHFPRLMLNEFPLRAILIPRITGRPDTRIVPSSAAAALRALAPATIFQLAGNERPAFKALAALTRDLPAFELELGTGLDRIPGVIDDFLKASSANR